MSMTPEEKFELLKTLIERRAEVRTYYKPRRVISIEKVAESYVVIKYVDGTVDKLRMQHFASRRFVAVI